MTQPGKDGVAQWGGAALPDLIEAMAGRSRQLRLRLVIGVLIACIVGPSLGAPLTVGWYVAWSLLQLAEVAWTRRAQRMSREQAVIGGVVLVALGSTVLASITAISREMVARFHSRRSSAPNDAFRAATNSASLPPK